MNQPDRTGFDVTQTEAMAVRAGPAGLPTLGVVIVSFNSGDVILDCLESLLAARDVRLRIVVVDNCSTDDTLARIRGWASGSIPYVAPDDMPFDLAPQPRPLRLVEAYARDGTAAVPEAPSLLLLHAGVNGGYAAGVNLGLAQLAAHADVDRFWVLNPDSAVPPDTPRAFATEGGRGLRFSLMGGRVNYLEDPDRIQIDGGRINWLTGATSNLNQGGSHGACPVPDTRDIDFISGASMVASREFYETAGPMQEDYFLYYEEVDWAMHRGNLPLAYCANGLVYHRAGTSIGSPVPGQVGSAMSIFFKHRNRMRFLRRYRPWSWVPGQLFTVGKAAQTLLKGHPREALVLLGAAFDLSPPPAVRKRLSPDAAMRAFGRSGNAGQ